MTILQCYFIKTSILYSAFRENKPVDFPILQMITQQMHSMQTNDLPSFPIWLNLAYPYQFCRTNLCIPSPARGSLQTLVRN